MGVRRLGVTCVIGAVAAALVGACTGTARPPGQATATHPAAQAKVTHPAAQAKVTGFASGNPEMRASGPVSVVLNGGSAARIDQIINSLPKTSAAVCMEDQLLYQITFTAAAGSRQGFDVAGWACNANVMITADGTTTVRRDVHCALLLAVRRVLPATAAATQHGSDGCVR